MNGIYLITTLGHGMGGHFHSLNAITDAFNDNVEYLIVNIGFRPSPVLSNKNEFRFIYFNGFNLSQALTVLKNIIKEFNPDYLHSFDDRAYLFGRLVNYRFKKGHILTKCGGPNIRFFPYNNNLILFSLENFNYYKARLKFKNANLNYLPNRLLKFEDDPILIAEIEKIAHGRKTFLRISRISDYYEKGLIQSIKLIDELVSYGFNVVLIIIGVIESERVYEKIKTISSNIIILTDTKFTKNAKCVINAFDLVIGTGRGLMEASSKNKLLLSPSDNMKYPIFVDDKTFNSLFSVNFSPRNNVDITDEKNLEKIVKSLKDSNYAKRSMNYIQNQFQNQFNIETVVNKYINLYKNIKFKRSFYNIDIIAHFLYVMKEFIAYNFKSRKNN